jgi:hypothetical protein
METTREIRALTIAATTQLRSGPGGWSVPSQSGGRPYKVDPVSRFCTCADHETRQIACKHILAVEFTIRRQKGKGGVYQVTEETVKVTHTHYHKRSNVETTFSMIKAKFGDALLSKSDTGQMNEVLAKVLAHNICVVIGAIHGLGIEARFGRAG